MHNSDLISQGKIIKKMSVESRCIFYSYQKCKKWNKNPQNSYYKTEGEQN